jgi:hypothetical protein
MNPMGKRVRANPFESPSAPNTATVMSAPSVKKLETNVAEMLRVAPVQFLEPLLCL